MCALQAAIYARLSRWRKDEQSASTETQVADASALCAERGWEVAHVIVDDDTSAFRGRRPGYERLLELIRGGDVGAVAAWHPERLTRSPREIEDLVDLVEESGVEIATVRTGRIDLTTPAGRLQARMLGAVARHESEHRSERTARAHQRIAEAGGWKGGRRPYGYRAEGGRLLIERAEANRIREAAERVLAGETLHGICADWNRRGVPTVTGARWRTPTLRRILCSPTVAGLREYRGQIVAAAQWSAILEPDVRLRLIAALERPGRGPVARVALLAGVTWCGCGARMLTATRGRRRGNVRVYRCSECTASIAAEPLERRVALAVIEHLDSPALMAAAAQVEEPPDDRADIERRLGELADLYAAGAVTAMEWVRARKGLEERLERLPAPRPASTAWIGRGAELADVWGRLTLDEQRAQVADVIDRVVVTRSDRRGPSIDWSRVRIAWR